MAIIPKQEEAARFIIDIFVERFNCRPGDVLRAGNFISAFATRPWQTTDFRNGMTYAAEQGWVDILTGGASFKLSEIGFSKAGEDEVNFESQCNEKITIERPDGSRDENVQSLVTDGMVLVPNANLPLAPGDAMLRQLPSGLVQRLIVTDPGFYAQIHGMPAHYQVKYRIDGQQPSGTPGHVIH